MDVFEESERGEGREALNKINLGSKCLNFIINNCTCILKRQVRLEAVIYFESCLQFAEKQPIIQILSQIMIYIWFIIVRD